MAKTSLIVKNKKIAENIVLYKEKRAYFSALLKSPESPTLSKFKAMKYLDKTKKASKVRHRNRCALTGRPRGYRGAFGISRNALRFYASFGMIPGVKKMS